MRIQLPWALAVLAAGLVVAAIALLAAGSSSRLPPPISTRSLAASEYAAWIVLAGVGARIATRLPANRVGWLLLAASVLAGVQLVVYEYAVAGLFVWPGSLPGAETAAGMDTWAWMPGYVLLMLALLHFPNGRLPSARWRWVWWLVAAQAASLVPLALASSRVSGRALLIEDDATLAAASVDPFVFFLPAVGLLSAVAAAAALSLLWRFVHGGSLERQQLKWLALPLPVFLVIVVLQQTADLAWDLSAESRLFRLITQALSALFTASVPTAIALAVLRYRLYDIDRLISRTVSYAVVSAVLVAVYATIAVVPSAMFELESDLLVAAATLAAAAAFVPVRRRVQTVVDRRFDRARYDAAAVVDRFGMRLRSELDLHNVVGDLDHVVRTTMQPAHVSLWLSRREGAR